MKAIKLFEWTLLCMAAVGLSNIDSAFATETSQPTATGIVDGRIGYVMATRHWAIYEAPGGKEVGGSAECPNGFNDGPREQFATLYPSTSERTVLGTLLEREGAQWFPSTKPEPLPAFKEARGKISFGMNLDGKIGPNDFTSPDGVKGIDNQLYRAIGCISGYRGPAGTLYDIENLNVTRDVYNRVVIEISGVDNLLNDDDVTVRSYRGLDFVLTDAQGAVIPGGSQRIDERWGKFVQATWKGKIIGGTLITEPADVEIPAAGNFSTSGTQRFKGLRFQLKLTPDHAAGLMAGYVDAEHFYRELLSNWATHFLSYGQIPATSLYRALKRLADGYPDPKTGEMTALSSALNVEFVRVSVLHPSGDKAARAKTVTH